MGQRTGLGELKVKRVTICTDIIGGQPKSLACFYLLYLQPQKGSTYIDESNEHNVLMTSKPYQQISTDFGGNVPFRACFVYIGLSGWRHCPGKRYL